MATNGSTSVVVTSYDTLKFNWWQVSQNITNNTTTVGWSLQLVAASNGLISSTASKAWSVSVNGLTYNGTNTVGIANNATKTLASGTTTITHNADGSKTFSYSFSQEFGINFGGTNIGTKSGSGSGTLNTIPRATQPTLSVSSVDMGGAVTISTPRASTSFTHDLAYKFAGSDWQAIATGVATSYAWTVPDKASSIPSATSGTMTIRCITKNGSTAIGTTTVLLTVKVPTSVVPVINSVATEETVSGLAAQFGAFVQSKSEVKVTVSASGAKGSTITKYSTTLLGKTYTGNSWTSDTLTTSGVLSLVTTVTDSRGRTAQKTTNITVLSYTPPKVTAFTARRYNASTGLADEDGTRVRTVYAYAVAALGNKNTAAMTISYKKSTDTTWSAALTSAALSADVERTLSLDFSTDYQYDLRIQVVDWFGATSTYQTVLPSGAVILDIASDGEGLAFFKTSERKGLELAAQTWFNNAEVPKDAKTIASTDNLNNYQTPGFYVFASASSSTIGNLPFSSGAPGSVQVIREGDGTQLRQVATRCSATKREIWERLYVSNSWQAWSCLYKGGSNTRLLFTGSLLMSASDTATLTEKVSAQPTGIVLVFGRYASGTAQTYMYSHAFVHKDFVKLHSGGGSNFFMTAGSLFAVVGSKYLYIYDDRITGNADNTKTGTANGITYNNAGFDLRYVLGV